MFTALYPEGGKITIIDEVEVIQASEGSVDDGRRCLFAAQVVAYLCAAARTVGEIIVGAFEGLLQDLFAAQLFQLGGQQFLLYSQPHLQDNSSIDT